MAEYKNKKLAGIRFLGIAVGIIIVMGFIAALRGSVTTENMYTSNAPTETINENGTTTYEVITDGTYVAGKDFNEGTYNIIATDGSGNVSSSNMYTGGIDGEISNSGNGTYKEYRDISLPKGTKLTVNGDVKIELVKVK